MSIIATRPPRFHRHTPRNFVRGLVGVALLVSSIACSGGGGLFEPSERLSPAAKATLDTLMLDEWAAQARYNRVLQSFGNVSPFTSLRGSRARRATALERVYLQMAEFTPANPYGPAVSGSAASAVVVGPAYESREQACEISLLLEQELVDRYDRLLALAPPRVVAEAARDNRALALEADLPAVRRCR